MALATSDHKSEPTPQKPTSGIGTQGAPVTTLLPPADPVLLPDIDPVLLVRLYPGAKDAADLRTQAMAAGKAAHDAAVKEPEA